MKSMGIFFTFVRQFSRKNTWKNILQEMKNGLSLRQQQLQVIMLYIITWAFHKLSCRQNEWYFYFVLTLKDTGIFPKLLFLSDSWVTAPVFHNHKHDTNGWMNLSIINVSVESFLLYPDDPLMSVVHHGRIIKQKLMH